jgi:hypothetical protein
MIESGILEVSSSCSPVSVNLLEVRCNKQSDNGFDSVEAVDIVDGMFP